MSPATIRACYRGQTTFERRHLEEGDFGAIAPYWCEICGLIWTAPEYGMTHRQTLWEPEEGENYCGECGSPETADNEAAPEPFKQTKRYRIIKRSAA